jgi:cellulose synthase/poly-beta-1,6-N-acetylglucosamine synthase-like glycosyltransferase
LRDRSPLESASQNLLPRQRAGLAAAALLVLSGLVVNARVTGLVLVLICVTLYITVVTYRLWLYGRSVDQSGMVTIDDATARSLSDGQLPRYTILIPAYREPEVIPNLIRAVKQFDYPAERLDVKLLLEADDAATIAAARAEHLGPPFDLILVPPAAPRTKPKALNYGLQYATGELVTIFDAEDLPDPLQLRRAVATFRRNDERLACVQACLVFHNRTQNLITRWFTLEYDAWFTQFLPSLVSSDAPIPLGGTSNHFRRDHLEEVGGWDPFNVTEDADLGLRLHRRGYRTVVLDSITWEEANSDFVNWVKQRSRWSKGYLQTWAVHLRQPRRLWRELGPKGFFQFNLFVGGTPLLALLNPVFWFLTLIWFLVEPVFVEALLPAPVYYTSLLCWLGGNFALTYLNLLVAESYADPRTHLVALCTPLYWVMMSIAAYKAAVQFVFQPSHWEKTVHGLNTGTTAAASS